MESLVLQTLALPTDLLLSLLPSFLHMEWHRLHLSNLVLLVASLPTAGAGRSGSLNCFPTQVIL